MNTRFNLMMELFQFIFVTDLGANESPSPLNNCSTP